MGLVDIYCVSSFQTGVMLIKGKKKRAATSEKTKEFHLNKFVKMLSFVIAPIWLVDCLY